MKLTDAQFGALHSLKDFGTRRGVEVLQMSEAGGRWKLECHLMNAATLAALERGGLVVTKRSPMPAPKNAVGKKGNRRREVFISISDKGAEAIA